MTEFLIYNKKKMDIKRTKKSFYREGVIMQRKFLFLAFLFYVSMLGLYAQDSWSWFESFEGAWPVPNWQMNGVAKVSTTYSSIPEVPRISAHSGSYSIGFSTVITNYVITPILLYPEGFLYFSRTNTGTNQITVEYQAEDGTPGPDIDGIWESLGNYISNTRWLPTYIDLFGYTNIYLRFRPTPPAPATKRYTYFDDITVYERNVPVELSSFTAALTQELFVNLHWSTQSETQIAGYNLYRSENNQLYDAIKINLDLIPAANSSAGADYDFQDQEAEEGIWYYWLQSNELDGSSKFFGPISINVTAGDAPDINSVHFSLNRLGPNPYNPTTGTYRGSYSLSKAEHVRMIIYNIKGQKIKTCVDDYKNIGYYTLSWDGRNDNGNICPAGMYYLMMKTDDFSTIKKITIIH